MWSLKVPDDGLLRRPEYCSVNSWVIKDRKTISTRVIAHHTISSKLDNKRIAFSFKSNVDVSYWHSLSQTCSSFVREDLFGHFEGQLLGHKRGMEALLSRYIILCNLSVTTVLGVWWPSTIRYLKVYRLRDDKIWVQYVIGSPHLRLDWV